MANTALQTITSNPIAQKAVQHLPAWLNTLIVVILGFWLADLVWAWVPLPDSPQAVAVQAAQPNTASPAVFYGAKVANKHIFGEADIKSAVKEIKDAPKTRLDLVLRGVLAHTPMDKALALISRGSGRQEVYAVGDSLPGNAELVEIHSDKVIIEYQGRYETLPIEQIRGVALQSSVAAKPANTATAKPAIAPQRAASLRQQFLADPAKLMSMVNIKQQRSGGKLLGYEINPKGDPSLFFELGLQAGDVLVSVNGLPVSNTQALNKLRGADQYDVVVTRGGAEVPLSISFR